MNTTDRRVRKTQKALENALAELMLQKELRNITIQELADKADIHRATFYSHYHDVYDLYEHMEQHIIQELSDILIEDPAHSYEQVYLSLIDYFYNHQTLSRVLFSSNAGTTQFQKDIYELVEEKYWDIWKYEIPDVVITEHTRYIATYHIQGFISLISRWVNQNFSLPKEEISTLLNVLDNNIDRVMP